MSTVPPSGSRAIPSRLVGVSLCAGIAVAAILVRLAWLDRSSYWLDEILETFTLRESWSGFWRSLRWQALQAPLDYVLRKLFETLDPVDWVRRLPSIVWGAGCVLAFGSLVRRRGGEAIGLSAALLLALAPYHVRYSQEVRPYALGLFLLCCALLTLETYLADGRRRDLLLFYLCCLATLYTLYLAGAVLALAAAALLLEDVFDGDPTRRFRARRFLARSPFFIGALAVGYLPWLPTFLKALHQPAMSTAPAWSVRRIGRFVSYFGFAPRDADPWGYADLFFTALLVGGLILAVRRPRLRFLIVWGIGGLAFLEFLEQRHPTYDSIFHWLPAGLGLTALAAVAFGWILKSRMWLGIRLALVVLFLSVALHSLSLYYQQGKSDWRPMARFLAQTPLSERLFVENQYTQLCLGYYVVGPDWLCCPRAGQREIVNLDGDLVRLMAAWDRTRPAWLVLAAGPRSEVLRSWASSLPSTLFPTAEGDGGGIVCRLGPPTSGR
jgi:hypothetical protein